MKKTHTRPVLLLILSTGVISCAPTVRLSTPDPVKIDVAMKVDVYTHEQKSSGGKKEPQAPQEARRLRMAEVQTLKNDRIIGEGADGYLKMKKVPVDTVYADYAQRILSEENQDRSEIFQREADEKDKPVEVVALEFSRRAREAAFPGEWIQTDSGEWSQK